MNMSNKFWIVPGAFFLVASLLILVGRLSLIPNMTPFVKPALMPLLAVATLAAVGSVQSRTVRLLILAQLLGGAGDVLLMGEGFLPFAGGMAFFLAGHICYICLFGGRSFKGLSWKAWLVAGVVAGFAVAALLRGMGIGGAMLGPMAVYSLALMLLIFSGLAGVVRFKGCAWWMILAGAVLFTVSDGLIATDTTGVLPFALKSFTVMLTYLAAQVLLAAGALRL